MNDDIELFRKAYATLVDAAPAPPEFERLDSIQVRSAPPVRRFGWKAAVAGFAVTMVAIGGVGVMGGLGDRSAFGAGTTTVSMPAPIATSIPVGPPTGFYVSDRVPPGFAPGPGSSSGLAATHDGEVALVQGDFGAAVDGRIAVVAVPAGTGESWMDDLPGEDGSIEAARRTEGVDLVAVGRGVSRADLESFLADVEASFDNGVARFAKIPAWGGEAAQVWPLAANPDWLSQTSYTSGGSNLTVGTISGPGQGVFYDVRIGDGRWTPADGGFAVPDFFVTVDAGDYTVIATGTDVSEGEFVEFFNGLRPVGAEEWQEVVGIDEEAPQPENEPNIPVASGDWWTFTAVVETETGDTRTCYWFDLVDPSPDILSGPTAGCVEEGSDGAGLWSSVGPAIQGPEGTVVLAVLPTDSVATVRVSYRRAAVNVEPFATPGSGVQFAAVEVPADWPSATVELLDESGTVLDTIELDSLTPGG